MQRLLHNWYFNISLMDNSTLFRDSLDMIALAPRHYATKYVSIVCHKQARFADRRKIRCVGTEEHGYSLFDAHLSLLHVSVRRILIQAQRRREKIRDIARTYNLASLRVHAITTALEIMCDMISAFLRFCGRSARKTQSGMHLIA